MNVKKPILAVAAMVVFGATAWAQLPTSKQSSSPTSNQYRMRILEPLEGATIRANEFNVVVGQVPRVPEGASVSPKEREDALKPTFQVWVDGKDLGNIPPGSNIMAVQTAGYGPHKIVVAAKNNAGELIDRKEISVTTAAPAMAEAAAPAPVAETRVETAPAPPPAPAPVAAPAPVEPPTRYTAESPNLPATGSSYPRLALLGFGLMVGGLWMRRRSS